MSKNPLCKYKILTYLAFPASSVAQMAIMKLPIKNEWSERNFCHRYARTIQDSQTFGLNYDWVIKTTAKQRCKRRCWNLVIILCSKMLHHACIRLETFQLFYGRKINEKTDRAQRQFALSFAIFYLSLYFSPSFHTACQIIKKIRAKCI